MPPSTPNPFHETTCSHKKIPKSPAIVTAAQGKSESPAIVTTAQEKSWVANRSDKESSQDAIDYGQKMKAMNSSKQAKDMRGRGNWWVVAMQWWRHAGRIAWIDYASL
jgi:hypothetical protein